jgi:hypothetical protein
MLGYNRGSTTLANDDTILWEMLKYDTEIRLAGLFLIVDTCLRHFGVLLLCLSKIWKILVSEFYLISTTGH